MTITRPCPDLDLDLEWDLDWDLELDNSLLIETMVSHSHKLEIYDLGSVCHIA